MKVSELTEILSLEVLSEGKEDKNIQGCYCSDLLSHCMSNVSENNIWITVQVNINIVAIGVLTEPAAIIISQDMQVDDEIIEKAKQEGVAILRSSLPSYELCVEVGKLI